MREKILVFGFVLLLMVASSVYGYKLTKTQKENIAKIGSSLTCSEAVKRTKKFEGFDFGNISPINILYANEIINIEITRTDGSKCRFGVETRNAKIYRIKEGFFEQPTLFVFSDEVTAIELSQKPSIKALQRAIDNGRIIIKAADFVRAVKLIITDIGLGLLNIFRNIASGKFLLFPFKFFA
ncbi:MAG: hypothetical protein J7L14_01660 [Candidatus Diapherotrites archaeon]|nr:hypothetical protein [Candidatus Diapherotrites archaeon]